MPTGRRNEKLRFSCCVIHIEILVILKDFKGHFCLNINTQKCPRMLPNALLSPRKPTPGTRSLRSRTRCSADEFVSEIKPATRRAACIRAPRPPAPPAPPHGHSHLLSQISSASKPSALMCATCLLNFRKATLSKNHTAVSQRRPVNQSFQTDLRPGASGEGFSQ